MNVIYIRPVTLSTGEIRATGEVLAMLPRSAMVQSRVTDLEGRLYAVATATVRWKPPSAVSMPVADAS
jgi:acyl-coenzyme A thioesterase PaaI-like protein